MTCALLRRGQGPARPGPGRLPQRPRLPGLRRGLPSALPAARRAVRRPRPGLDRALRLRPRAGRGDWSGPGRPPFYAVRVLAGTIGTKGGPVTDADGRVLTEAGTPVPGLYAAGNVAAFWTGDAYPAPGATLGIAMTFGYLADRHAASRGQIMT